MAALTHLVPHDVLDAGGQVGIALKGAKPGWATTHTCARKTSVYDRAGALAPGTPLRSLDAIHIAAASALGAALSYFVTYDKRLLTAAEAHGLPVATPA